MTATTIKLSKLKPNPDNPRLIKDDKFHRMVENILKYPKFLEKRPIVHKDFIVQGGNQRLRGIKHIVKLLENEFNALCHKLFIDYERQDLWIAIRKDNAIPVSWVADASDYNAEEVKAFIIIDNVEYGEHDWDKLANEWDTGQLISWGLDVWPDPKHIPDLLDVDEESAASVSELSRPATATHNDYSVYEQLMHHENKVVLLEVLNQVKNTHQLEKLEDALMHIVNYYKSNNP